MLSALPPGTSLFSIEGGRAVLSSLTEAVQEMSVVQKIALVAAAILVGSSVGGACAVTCSFFMGSILSVSSSTLLALGIGSGGLLFGGAAGALFALASSRAEAGVVPAVAVPLPGVDAALRDEASTAPETEDQRRLEDLWQHFQEISTWLAAADTSDREVTQGHYDWTAFPVVRSSRQFGQRFTIKPEEIPGFLRQHPNFRQSLQYNVDRVLNAWQNGEDINPIRAGKMAASLTLFMPEANEESQLHVRTCFMQLQQRLRDMILARGWAPQLVGQDLEWAHVAIFGQPYAAPAVV